MINLFKLLLITPLFLRKRDQGGSLGYQIVDVTDEETGLVVEKSTRVHAEDDKSVVVENSLLLRSALIGAGVPVQTHLYPDGGHGFGLRLAAGKTVEGWQDLFHNWGRKRGLFT